MNIDRPSNRLKGYAIAILVMLVAVIIIRVDEESGRSNDLYVSSWRSSLIRWPPFFQGAVVTVIHPPDKTASALII